MSMPTAPGQNFLKITGIFYKIAGGLIIISALIVHFSNIIRSLISAPESSNTLGYIFHTADNALQIWKLTAANNVFAMLERLHNIVPALTSVSIMHSRLPERPIHLVYATYLSLPVNFTIWSFVLTFVAVIIGIFILFTGIIAVKYCDTLKHSKRVMIFALVNLGLIIAGTIFCVSFLSVLGCAIAALYFAGAFQNHITYEKTYMKTDKTPCIKKMVKYVVITAVPILCMTILFIALFQPKEVQLINDSKFYLNGDKDSAYIHIIDENHLQLIDFDIDSLTKNFEERLGFQGGDLEFIQKLYIGEIEFEIEENRINAILPRYIGYDTGFSIAYINENTLLFREKQYIKQ